MACGRCRSRQLSIVHYGNSATFQPRTTADPDDTQDHVGALTHLQPNDAGARTSVCLRCFGGNPVGGGAIDLSVQCAIYDLANAVFGRRRRVRRRAAVTTPGKMANFVSPIYSKHKVGNIESERFSVARPRLAPDDGFFVRATGS